MKIKGTKKADHLIGTQIEDGIAGGRGADYLSGGGGNDVIRGGRGNDILDGGSGYDTLIGGKGKDIFIVQDPDQIMDFEAGKDRLMLDIAGGPIQTNYDSALSNLYILRPGQPQSLIVDFATDTFSSLDLLV